MAAQVEQKPGANWQVGATVTSSVAFTRPNDTTQYTAGDVVGDNTTNATLLRFPNMALANGGGGIIQSSVLIDSVAAATKPDLELYLFDTPLIVQADNAAWNPSDQEILGCVCVIYFPAGSFKTAGANGIIQPANPTQPYNCNAGDTALYGVLVARNAYTPTALEVFRIRLNVLRD